MVLVSVLCAQDAETSRVEQARETGYWEVSQNETLLGIAQQLLPDKPSLYTNFVSDVIGLNFEIFGGVNRNHYKPGIRILLPDYVLSETAVRRRHAASNVDAETVAEVPVAAQEEVKKTSPGKQKKISKGTTDRLTQARKSGRLLTRPGDNMFLLARLFYPTRTGAHQRFIQDVIQMNPDVFARGEINALPSGAVLELPGYVWDQARKAEEETSGLNTRALPETVKRSQVLAVEPAQPDEDTVQDAVISVAGEERGSEPVPNDSVADYVDNYLSDAPDYIDQEAIDEAEQKAGRRVLDVTTHYYQNDDDFIGDETEVGVNVHWRRETLNYGEIDMDMSVSNVDRNGLLQTKDDTDLLFTVRQSDMPLSSTWLLDTTLGHQRSVASPFLQGGYRFRLPTSPLLGLSGEADSRLEQLQWFLGNTGSYEGIALRQFEADDGLLAGISYEREMTAEWRLGGKVVTLQDHPETPEHSSLLLAGRYQTPGSITAHELHLLADNEGHAGIWTDSSNGFRNGMSLRYGGFYIEPKLSWTDSAIANDQFGLYTRLDKRGVRHDFSTGYDYFETGLDEAVTVSENHSLYFNNNYRISRRLTFGLSANMAQRTFKAVENDQQDSWRLQGFIYQSTSLGTSRYDVFSSELDSDNEGNRKENQGVRWSHDWRMPNRFRLTTELSAENDRRFSDDQQQYLVGTIFRHDVNDELSWSINTALIRSDSDKSGSSNDVSLNASTRWQFLPDWYTSLSVNYNQTSTDIATTEFITNDEEITTDGFWLTLGYSKATGRSFPNFGFGNNRAGSGNLYGTVFYDDNRDGSQQPGERVAKNVIVMLDGRYETRTDSQGRFSYNPVPAGQHFVRILVEDLPLPWGLEDESPQLVNVGVRQNREINFGLIRTDQ